VEIPPINTPNLSWVTELRYPVLIGDAPTAISFIVGQKKDKRGGDDVGVAVGLHGLMESFAMLKLSDPLKSELFVGLFYNAETEDRGFRPRGEKKKLPEALTRWLSKSERVMRWIITNVSSYMTRQQAEKSALENEDFNGKLPEALMSDLEAPVFEFRPLTEEEKKAFLNSLDERGKEILAELEGRKTKIKRPRESVAKVVESDAASIVPNTNISTSTPAF